MRRNAIALYSITLIIFNLGFCSLAFCERIYVNSDVEVSGVGNSWSTAIKYLSTAINKSADGDEIWVKYGIYKEDNLLVSNKIKIYGGFIGNEQSLQDRDWDTNKTILEPHSVSSPAAHIFIITKDSTIDGFSISSGGHGFDDGGGIYVKGCSVELGNITFSDNKGIAGGAIYSNADSFLNIKNCIFDNNEADYGGAINSAGELSIENCKFSYNRALDGGAIQNGANKSEISACYFHGNRATNGAALHFSPSLGNIVRNSIFYLNYAQEDGGAIYIDESLINIIHCTFHRNTANLDGGAIFYRPVDQGLLIEPKIINSIFWHNVDFDFLGNYQYNSIFVSSNGGFWPIHLYNTVIDDRNIEDWGIGENIINADPKLDNTPDRPLHLKLGSPCIDACKDIEIEGATGLGFIVSPVPELIFDVDGDPRIMGNKPDIGADELIVVDVDIKPGLCPNYFDFEDGLKLMVALVGKTNFDIHRVKPKTAKLLYRNHKLSNGSIFVDYGDYSSPANDTSYVCDCNQADDGFDDLLLEFNLNNINKLSKLKVRDPVLELDVIGFLNDGSPFRGIDCLNIDGILP